MYLHSDIYVHCTRSDIFSWRWRVECRDSASVLDVPRKALKYELQVKVYVKNVKYVNVKFSLRFLTHDAMKKCAGVEVQIHLFLTMTLD